MFDNKGFASRILRLTLADPIAKNEGARKECGISLILCDLHNDCFRVHVNAAPLKATVAQQPRHDFIPVVQ